ncbi:MAG: hypothetical protein JG774_1407 [Desulfomicrobiaceae bacterium]|jgi:hypothetical protein|nr:hypothetical protein [Desulfomicrobiaceae bacterium]
MGPTTRCSTSRGLAPGMETSMSIMGTTIWGSSSLGVLSTATTPKSRAKSTVRGTSLESTKSAVRRWSRSPE